MEKKKAPRQKSERSGDLDFEAALKELEKIALLLERGEMGLEDSLLHYERGMKLAGLCHTKLQEAEKKIEILQKTSGGGTESREVSYDDESGEIEDDDMQGSLL